MPCRAVFEDGTAFEEGIVKRCWVTYKGARLSSIEVEFVDQPGELETFHSWTGSTRWWSLYSTSHITMEIA